MKFAKCINWGNYPKHAAHLERTRLAATLSLFATRARRRPPRQDIAMKPVTLYGTGVCPYCDMAERLLARKGVTPDKIRVDLEPEQREHMMRITGRRTVPQIFIGELHVGGYDDLSALDRAGKLDALLAD